MFSVLRFDNWSLSGSMEMPLFFLLSGYSLVAYGDKVRTVQGRIEKGGGKVVIPLPLSKL